MLGTMAGCPIHVDRIPNPDNQPRFAEGSRFFAVAPQVREWALTGDRLPAAPSVSDRRSSRDGNPPGFRLEFLGFQAAGVENSRGVSVMKRSKTPAVDPVELRTSRARQSASSAGYGERSLPRRSIGPRQR